MPQPLPERLYRLLPGLYQSQDALYGEPLRALLALLEQELQTIETDIAGLYDNWFIETCQDWVVPYLADLLDAQKLYSKSPRATGQERRAYVANTLAYRRRKGTATVLEQLAQDITGWRGRAVVFQALLAQAQSLNTGLPAAPATVSLHPGSDRVGQGDRLQPTGSLQATSPLSWLGSPFGGGTYTAEVRRISRERGRFNGAQVGLFLWRLQSYPLQRGTARAVELPQNRWRGRCYRFSPLGQDQPLFNLPRTKTELTNPTEPIHVPDRLYRTILLEEVNRRRRDRALEKAADPGGYLGEDPVLQVFFDGQRDPVPAENLLITSLDGWEQESWKPPTIQPDAETHDIPYDVAVDPELGRLVILTRTLPKQVEVSYHYGFSGDLGGGSYDRRDSSSPTTDTSPSQVVWTVQSEVTTAGNPLAAAIDQWHQTTQAWQRCADRTYLPLARLVVSPDAWSTVSTQTVEDRSDLFRPGIIQGLHVLTHPGATQAIVSPGTAIDGQGRLIRVSDRQPLPLSDYKGQSVLVVVAYAHADLAAAQTSSKRQRWQLELIPITTELAHSQRTYIRLSLLTIDSRGRVISQSAAKRKAFQPGIVRGLSVRADGRGVTIAAGLGVNQQGQRIVLGSNQHLDLKRYRGQTAFLLLSHRFGPGIPAEQTEGQQPWRLQVIPEAEIDRYPATTHLRLARLEIPRVAIQTNDASVRLPFQSGIVRGLTLLAYPGRDRAVVTAGLAIGSRGETLRLEMNTRLNLQPYAQQTVTVLLAYRVTAEEGLRYQIQLGIPTADWRTIPLGVLTLGADGEIIEPPNLDETQPKVRQRFQPGLLQTPRVLISSLSDPQDPDVTKVAKTNFINSLSAPQDLEVTKVAKTNTAQVAIAPGTAIDRQGRLIKLKRTHLFDLSASAGQTVILYLAHDREQGWRINTVVEEAPIGVITLTDNHTYGPTNLKIAIPAGKQLHLIAANGCRPHLQGNLAVQGLAGTGSLPSQLRLDGLLLEGQLTVLPGNLQQLSLNHCTLVPQQGGLVVGRPNEVQRPQVEEPQGRSLPASPSNASGQLVQLEPSAQQVAPLVNQDWSLIALALYYINLIWKIAGINLDRTVPPAQTLSRLVNLGLERFQRLIHELWQAMLNWQRCHLVAPPTDPDATNDQLTIALNHCLCGPIHLNETVPSLSISNSVVDQGQRRGAIVAPGTQVTIEATTILGSTTALSLEASNALFSDHVLVWRRQIGGLRFCSLPNESQTPRRFRCQPDWALSKQFIHLPARITCFAATDTTLYAGTAGDGVYRYDRQDGQWTAVQQGLTNLQVNTLAVDAATGTVFAGTTAGYIFQSHDRGDTWTALIQLRSDVPTHSDTNSTHINHLLIQDSWLFAATLGGRIFRSPDMLLNPGATNNTSWTAPQQGLEQAIWNINVLAVNPQTGMIAAGTAGTGVYLSLDNGTSWHRPASPGLTNQNITALAIHPHTGQLYAGTQGALTKDGGIFYTLNNGDTWTSANLDFRSRTIHAIAIHPETGAVFAATAGNGLLRSLDQGKTWRAIEGLPSRNVTAIAVVQPGPIAEITSPNCLVAGTAGGAIWCSQDNGDTWFALNRGLTQVEEKISLLNALQPSFTSTQYGDPGYAQLSLTCASEIRMGAEDGSEMGGFNYLKQPQREANLRTSLEEYLGMGLEAGIFYRS